MPGFSFTNSQVLYLGGMRKGDFSARRARGFLTYLPVYGTIPEGCTRVAAKGVRNKYSLADAVVLDLFQTAASARLDNSTVDNVLRHCAPQLYDALARDFCSDCIFYGHLMFEGRCDQSVQSGQIGTRKAFAQWLVSTSIVNIFALDVGASKSRVAQRFNATDAQP